MDHNQLKDIIANNDMDEAIIEKEYHTIDAYLRDMGYYCRMSEIKKAVNDLVKNDRYYQQRT